MILALLLAVPFSGSAQEFTYAGSSEAPAFPEELQWLNVPAPLTLAALQGKIVLLDFWTYGCINCMHVIPDLKRLEAEYADELVVIGVHSAKFEGEGVTDNIRQIIQRYEIEHPVVNDADFQIWRQYQARAWPSLYLIDPLGKVVGRHEGEGVYAVLAPVLEVMAQEYGDAGLIDPTPLVLDLERDALPDTPLRFPGAVLVDEAGGRLFISDSGHHRVVVADLNNFTVQQIIGTGAVGFVDGDFASATFNAPQGMELVGEVLYLADTNNHAIRAIDLNTQSVTTIAGTGRMETRGLQQGVATDVALRSPWDVVVADDTLYIAMAGSHQLWQLNLETSVLKPFAGNGREDLIDAPLADAELAQPSHMIADSNGVYFADSESSSIRYAEFGEEGRVKTVVGPVNEPQARLFTFGDVDGGINEARLQHPLGVTLDEAGMLYITDTYNNKIKRIDPQTQTIATFAGLVEGGYYDGSAAEAQFDEPGGLDYHRGKLYIADTNNHAIRVIDTASQSVSTVIFPNVTALLPADTALTDTPLTGESSDVETVFGGNNTLVLDMQMVAPGAGAVLVDAIMPFGYKLNASAPFTAVWSQNPTASIEESMRDYRVITPDLPIEFPVTFTEGQTNLGVELTIYWCEAIKETLCFVERGTVVLPVTVSPEAVSTVLSLQYQLIPPDFGENTLN